MGLPIPNPRKVALNDLRAYVAEKMDPLGVEDTSVEVPVGPVADLTSASGGINASDIWTGDLADAQNDAMKTDVTSLGSAFSGIVSAIDTECLGLENIVDSESDEGKWPNA
ncbi:hypothetical protein NSA19_10115 [Actinomyces bowdenii]|uniref:hypothetical protein n=1 Tax=Actinomyces bowdenii TaxID=131109 RepID=UPI00214AE5D3|nr:hypothetical protein [Actinomyces bowdenii]MCR2053186.1 hypothetical protein [Actinomyces bowdenii]